MRSGALIALRPGGSRKLFLVHDGEGETLVYLNLARRMPDNLAVFAIEPHRIARVPLAHTTIEDMAAFYIGEVRKEQPRGPYLLGGLCAGGVIAYEMASQMVRSGESVELLVLLEAATPDAQERPGRIRKQRLGRLRQTFVDARQRAPWRRAAVVAGAISRKLMNALRWEIAQRNRQWWARARYHLLRGLLTRKLRWPRLIPELSVRQIYDSAQARYQPKPLTIASIVLVRARTGEGDDTPNRNVYTDETFGWSSIARELTLIDVEGGHSTMLEERFVNSLAEAILPYLQQNHGSIRERPLEVKMV
jgi:thioesterase domain-containing protein